MQHIFTYDVHGDIMKNANRALHRQWAEIEVMKISDFVCFK